VLGLKIFQWVLERLTGLHSTFQPRDFAIWHTLSLVTLLITFLLSGTTMVMPFSGVPLTPMKPEVENSSISLLVALSKWRVMPKPSPLALSLKRSTGA
jgi:hypothetical protein